MNIFQILFVAVNIAIPYWLWTGTSKAEADMDWVTWERNVGRLVDGEGGFEPCGTNKVVTLLRDLCETSKQKMHGKSATVVEQAGQKMVFACEVGATDIIIHWFANSDPKLDLDCEIPTEQGVSQATGFSLTKRGRMKSLEFLSKTNQPASVTLQNCRKKVTRAKTLPTPPPTVAEFLSALGPLAHDPKDYISANYMCLLFDPSPLWQEYRELYLQ